MMSKVASLKGKRWPCVCKHSMNPQPFALGDHPVGCQLRLRIIHDGGFIAFGGKDGSLLSASAGKPSSLLPLQIKTTGGDSLSNGEGDFNGFVYIKSS